MSTPTKKLVAGYLFFVGGVGLVSVGLSLVISMEMSSTTSILQNEQLFNSVVTAHAFTMIFFMFTMIMGFIGHYLLTMVGGGVFFLPSEMASGVSPSFGGNNPTFPQVAVVGSSSFLKGHTLPRHARRLLTTGDFTSFLSYVGSVFDAPESFYKIWNLSGYSFNTSIKMISFILNLLAIGQFSLGLKLLLYIPIEDSEVVVMQVLSDQALFNPTVSSNFMNFWVSRHKVFLHQQQVKENISNKLSHAMWESFHPFYGMIPFLLYMLLLLYFKLKG